VVSQKRPNRRRKTCNWPKCLKYLAGPDIFRVETDTGAWTFLGWMPADGEVERSIANDIGQP